MQVKDALTFAKEAFGVMKNDPKALYLLGRVLAHSGEPGRAKARRVLVCAFHRTERGQAYQNAIAKDKYCTDAVISLVRCTDVRMVDGVSAGWICKRISHRLHRSGSRISWRSWWVSLHSLGAHCGRKLIL